MYACKLNIKSENRSSSYVLKKKTFNKIRDSEY